MTQTWDNSRLGFFVGVGVAVWLIATVIWRLTIESLFGSGNLLVLALAFMVSIPAMWGLVVLIARLGRVEGTALLPSISVVGFVGLMLDALAVVFFPTLFALEGQTLRLLAGMLLWHYGLCLMFAFYLARPLNK